MRRKIFSPQSRRKTEKEKDENIWSAEKKKNREGKGGKYLEKEIIWSAGGQDGPCGPGGPDGPDGPSGQP